MTRVDPAARFEKGIHPLHEQLEDIWDFLFEVQNGRVSDKEWAEFRQRIETSHNSNSSYQYRLKSRDNFYSGPYAHLVLDIIWKAPHVGVHYLRSPEIVTDICRSFMEIHGIDLESIFRNKTRACVVKFLDNAVSPNVLEAALLYLYYYGTDEGLSLATNTCFNGNGKEIPGNRVVGVQFYTDQELEPEQSAI